MRHRALAALLVSAVAATVSLSVAAGCSEQEPEEPAAGARTEATAEAEAHAEAEAIGRAKRAAKQLGTTLKRRLGEAMEQGGPSEAIEVCATEALELTDGVSEETGLRVGRSSLKLRNPDNAGPAWVRAWLEEQGDAAEGVEPVARVEDGEARFVAPIAVEALCVTCHGAPDAIPQGVREVLSERYPNDEAVGYAPGDLRGAIWATAPVQ